MNILITGGAGYLGTTLVNVLLNEGHRIRVLDSLVHGIRPDCSMGSHPNLHFTHGDIRDRETLADALPGIEAVVHLAAIVGDPACARNPAAAREVNLKASLLLLEECRRTKVRHLVFASTCSNYGCMPDSEAYVDETSPLAPLSVYAETKVEFEKVLLEMTGSERLCATALRLATLYGVSPRMRFDLTVNEFTLDILLKKHLVVFGEHAWRPYVHVRDAARAILQVLNFQTCQGGQVFNVGDTNQNFRKADLVELVRVHSSDARIEFIPGRQDLRDYRVCFDKISRQLGFSIQRTVEDGISEVAHFVRSKPGACFEGPSFRN